MEVHIPRTMQDLLTLHSPTATARARKFQASPKAPKSLHVSMSSPECFDTFLSLLRVGAICFGFCRHKNRIKVLKHSFRERAP